MVFEGTLSFFLISENSFFQRVSIRFLQTLIGSFEGATQDSHTFPWCVFPIPPPDFAPRGKEVKEQGTSPELARSSASRALGNQAPWRKHLSEPTAWCPFLQNLTQKLVCSLGCMIQLCSNRNPSFLQSTKLSPHFKPAHSPVK